MGVHVVAIYRPHDGEHAELQAEMVDHVPLLRRLGLATATPSRVLRASDGTLADLPNASTMFPEFEFVGSY